MVDGVFEPDGAGGTHFHKTRGVGPATIAEIETQVGHRLLSVLARRGVLECEDAETMGSWDRLLNLRKQPFVCPDPDWLYWVESSPLNMTNDAERPAGDLTGAMLGLRLRGSHAGN